MPEIYNYKMCKFLPTESIPKTLKDPSRLRIEYRKAWKMGRSLFMEPVKGGRLSLHGGEERNACRQSVPALRLGWKNFPGPGV